MLKSKKNQMDMTKGPLLSKIILFTLPVLLTNLAQLLFHAADLIVLGLFGEPSALAAVGATNGLTVLVLNLFYGISSGINVLVARYTGSKEPEKVSINIHTAMAVAIYVGVSMAILCIFLSKSVLQLMGTPENILDKATLYMWIYCAGMPFVILFNFGAAILRAIGDAKRPMMFIMLAGVVNVVLNLIFVIVFKWDVAGVALATKISNLVSAILVLLVLFKSKYPIKFVWQKMAIHYQALKEMLAIGLPSAVQGACYSFSSVIIQSSVNSLGWQAIAGNTAAQSLEGLVYVSSSALFFTAISFTGQNHGAKRYKRILKVIFLCIASTVVVSLVGGLIVILLGKSLLGLYNNNAEVIQWGWVRLKLIIMTYCLCGVMDVISGVLRGLGHSIKPMVITILGVCLFRILYVAEIFPHFKSLECLVLSYPISWIIVIAANGSLLYFILRKMLKKASKKEFTS
jgi:putative MATE family efflux protein